MSGGLSSGHPQGKHLLPSYSLMPEGSNTRHYRCKLLLAGWTVGARTEPNEDGNRMTRYHNRNRTRHRRRGRLLAGWTRGQDNNNNNGMATGTTRWGEDINAGGGHPAPPPHDNHNSQETTRRMSATLTTTSPLTAALSNCSWGGNGSNKDWDGKESRRNNDDGMISTSRPCRERLLEGMETQSDDGEREWDKD